MSIREAYYYCELAGSSFDPTSIEFCDPLHALRMHHIGEMGKVGRYKDIPLDYGSITLTGDVRGFDFFVRALSGIAEQIRNCRADWKVIHLDLNYVAQCNTEFSPGTLELISRMGLTLTLSCSHADEDRE